MNTTIERRTPSSIEARKAAARRSSAVVTASIAVTAILFFVPSLHMVAYPLLLLSTFVHEMGHGIAAELVGGDFVRFEMFSDASGVATLRLPATAFASAFSSFGGLAGPAVVGAALFMVGAYRRACGPVLWALFAFFVASALLYVRNPFGLVFVGVYAAVFFAIARFGSDLLQQFTVVFLGAQLCLSVFSRGDYLFTQYAQTANGMMPSDVQQIADALFLPYWFWGAMIGLFSAASVIFGVWFSLRAIVQHAADPIAPKRLR